MARTFPDHRFYMRATCNTCTAIANEHSLAPFYSSVVNCVTSDCPLSLFFCGIACAGDAHCEHCAAAGVVVVIHAHPSGVTAVDIQPGCRFRGRRTAPGYSPVPASPPRQTPARFRQRLLGLSRQRVEPRRMSVTPAANQIRVLLGTGITSSDNGPDPKPATAPPDPLPGSVARPTA